MMHSRMMPKGVGRFAEFGEVFCCAGMAAWAGKLWAAPDATSVPDISSLCLLMILEFVLLHSGAFMVFALACSLWFFLLFVVMYGVIVGVIVLAAEDSSILWLYCCSVFFRLLGGFSQTQEGVFNRQFKAAFIRLWIFFVPVGLIFWGLPYTGIPRLGLSAEFLGSINYAAAVGASSVLPRLPHVSMCAAVAGYSCMALFDFWLALNPRRLTGPM